LKNVTFFRLGDDALLNCKVTSLEKDLVSWLRKDPETGIPVVLTVGFVPHSAENRFLLDFQSPNNYRLRIQNVHQKDEGMFICQLSVHPPSIMWATLEVIRPVVHLLDGDGNPVNDLHYDSGSTIDLLCRVRRPPLFQVSVRWEKYDAITASADSPDEPHVLNADVTRGGVKVDTGRDPKTGWLLSRLKLSKAMESDTGNYTCKLVNHPLLLDINRYNQLDSMMSDLSDTISVHVIRGENTEAIYGSAAKIRHWPDWRTLSALTTIFMSTRRQEILL
jgi:hypothetical protein